MITPEDVRSLRGRATDRPDTAGLKAMIAGLRTERSPLFLTAAELEAILQWKLGQQIGRQRARWAANTDDLIRRMTRLALSPLHADNGYECELRLGILCTLRDVSVPVASAVLAIVYPDDHAIIDFRVWRRLFDEERTVFSIGDYRRYLRKLMPIAQELGCPVQRVDHAIWELDRRSRHGSSDQSQVAV
jgi:hypothetical protein